MKTVFRFKIVENVTCNSLLPPPPPFLYVANTTVHHYCHHCRHYRVRFSTTIITTLSPMLSPPSSLAHSNISTATITTLCPTLLSLPPHYCCLSHICHTTFSISIATITSVMLMIFLRFIRSFF